MNLNETIICYKKIAESNRDSYVCFLETSYQNQLQNKAIMDRHKRKAENYEQLAEWLEELKEYRSVNRVEQNTIAYQNGYTTAIDDFGDRLSKYLDVGNATKYGNENAEQQINSYSTLMKYEIADAIDDVAEQLKEGGVVRCQ